MSIFNKHNLFFVSVLFVIQIGNASALERLDSISNAADRYVGNDPKMLDSLAHIALDLAVIEKDLRIQCLSLMQIGIASAMKGDNAHALKRMNEAWHVAKEIDNTRLMVNCLTNMAGVFELSDLPEKAKDKLELAVQILEKSRLEQTKANTYLTLSIVQEKLGDFEGSKHSVSQAMAVFHKKKNVDRYFYCVEQLGNLLHRNKQYEEAIELYTFAINGWIWKDEMGKLIALHAERGKGFFYQGQFTKAKLDLGFAYSLADSFNIVHSTDSILDYQLKTAATLGENHLIALYTDRLTKLFNSRNENKAAEIVASIQNDCLTNQHALEMKLETTEASLISTRNKSTRNTWLLSAALLLFVLIGLGLRFTSTLGVELDFIYT